MAGLSISVPDRVHHRKSDEIYIISKNNNSNNIKIRDDKLDIKNHIQTIKELEQWNPVLKAEFPLKTTVLINEILPAFKIEMGERGTIFPIIKGKSLNITSWMSYTYPFNMTGLPAASIPCGWTKEGLPIGMQIIGRRYDEKTVLQVSKAFEEIAPWQDKKPQFN